MKENLTSTCLVDGRIQVGERLGSGSYGDVYRAHDVTLSLPIAVKFLRRTGEGAVRRFKSEFRTLANIDHPNLVTLFELFGDTGDWFFTMELVEGPNLMARLRGGSVTLSTTLASEGSIGSPRRAARPTRTFLDATGNELIARLLLDLEAGLTTLHESGHLHCDIKPSNVLVRRDDDSLVLLDFGLVAQDGRADGEISGTPAYMSPEQAAGEPLTTASDWYSVGTALFEVLTGQLPFYGSAQQILSDKRQRSAPMLESSGTALEKALAELTNRLLATEPRARPAGSEIVELLRPFAAPPLASGSQSVAVVTPELIGRSSDLSRLRKSYDDVVASRDSRAVLLLGDSGIGKTALCSAFVRELRKANQSLVLSSRCYQAESIPYKAFDELVEQLAAFIGSQSVDVLAKTIPKDADLLARLFPALAAVTKGVESGVYVEPAEMRRRAFAAFAALLAAVSERLPVVIVIDDLQWGDVESSQLLLEVLRTRRLSLLVVGASRDAQSPALTILRERSGNERLREQRLGPLTHSDAIELAQSLLARDDERSSEIASESQGSPFFVRELAQEAKRGHGPIRISDVVRTRLEELDVEPKAVLAALAVAGIPVKVDLLQRAIDSGSGELVAKAVPQLRALSLLRSAGGARQQAVAPYHDRIRHAVLDSLAPHERAAISRSLAVVLEGQAEIDAATVGRLWRGAGDDHRALGFLQKAGSAAVEALAFERAASLFREATEIEGGDTRETLERLAAALVNAGRGGEAAAAYLEAAERASSDRALELRRCAAEHLLRSGRVEEGMALIHEVFATLGIRVPGGPRRALASLLANRARLAVRGFRYKERSADSIGARELVAIDACASLGVGMALVDHIQGADFQLRALLRALKAGDPTRVARTLALEIGFSGISGGRGTRRTGRLIERATTLIDALGDPLSTGIVRGAIAAAHHQSGRFADAARICNEALTSLEPCSGASWERSSALFLLLGARCKLGELRGFRKLHRETLGDAFARGDVYATVLLRLGWHNLAWVSADNCAGAEVAVDEAMSTWPSTGFHVQHLLELIARTHLNLYRGDIESARSGFYERWPSMRRSLLLRSQNIRVETHVLRANIELAAARATDRGRARANGLRIARRCAKLLRRERMGWIEPFATLIEAGAADIAGETRVASTLCSRAARGFAEHGWAVHALVARRAGAMLESEDLEPLDAALIEAGVASPQPYSAMFAPSLVLRPTR